jgi:hypothetical protein
MQRSKDKKEADKPHHRNHKLKTVHGIGPTPSSRTGICRAESVEFRARPYVLVVKRKTPAFLSGSLPPRRGLFAKTRHHHCRQRDTVLRLTPTQVDREARPTDCGRLKARVLCAICTLAEGADPAPLIYRDQNNPATRSICGRRLTCYCRISSARGVGTAGGSRGGRLLGSRGLNGRHPPTPEQQARSARAASGAFGIP